MPGWNAIILRMSGVIGHGSNYLAEVHLNKYSNVHDGLFIELLQVNQLKLLQLYSEG
jgi:hypothetical protein